MANSISYLQSARHCKSEFLLTFVQKGGQNGVDVGFLCVAFPSAGAFSNVTPQECPVTLWCCSCKPAEKYANELVEPELMENRVASSSFHAGTAEKVRFSAGNECRNTLLPQKAAAQTLNAELNACFRGKKCLFSADGAPELSSGGGSAPRPAAQRGARPQAPAVEDELLGLKPRKYNRNFPTKTPINASLGPTSHFYSPNTRRERNAPGKGLQFRVKNRPKLRGNVD